MLESIFNPNNKKKKKVETDSSLIFIQPILRHCTTFSFHRQDEARDPINLVYPLCSYSLKIAYSLSNSRQGQRSSGKTAPLSALLFLSGLLRHLEFFMLDLSPLSYPSIHRVSFFPLENSALFIGSD